MASTEEEIFDPLRVDASPTKAFFVDIITRDINLEKAIQDLVDNCVDGAKRLRPGPEPDYSGLAIELNLSAKQFSIKDNCGGIPLDVARKYAFKFGRAKEFESTPYSVGQFGVGMKRSLFKMGDHFRVKSAEPNSSFEIAVDVESWLTDPNWDFKIQNLEEKPNPVGNTGTEIVVEPLSDNVAIPFGSNWFVTNLRNKLRITQQHFMRRGLSIVVNGEAVISAEWQLLSGQGIEPLARKFEDDLGGQDTLKTRIFAGTGSPSGAHAGWYVFCNGRCILDADQSPKTGWSEGTDDGVRAPRYHGQFSRFRGYAFLDCQDASILPWNTTKTDLDEESDAYRRLKIRLIEAMRPVIDFLNNLDAEMDVEESDRQLTESVSRASSVALENLPERTTFVYKQPPKKGPPLTTITYKKLQSEVDEMKSVFGAYSNKEVGEKSFEYAYENLADE